MAGLAETVADLVARARAASPDDDGGRLTTVAGFGSNPGALRMRLHVPDGLPARAPLVVVLHGCGQTAAGYSAGAGWLELADRYGFVALCPEQVRANNANLCFNWFEDADVARVGGEAQSIAQMVAHALAEFDLDPARVFVTGLSAGGAMTAVMLATYPELFAAGAVVAGLPYGAASGVAQAMAAMRRAPAVSAREWGDKVRRAAPRPARRPRVAIWRGDADATVTSGAGDALAMQWCDVHGVTDAVETPTHVPRHGRRTWRDRDGEAVVELHTVAGLGHGTPIAAGGPDGCGAAGPWILEAGVSSSCEIVRFWGLAERRRPRPQNARRRTQTPSASPSAGASFPPVNGVGETIARALRSAGLLR